MNETIGQYLKSYNHADAPERMLGIWFCFDPPCDEGEAGIRPLLENWGGEALYGSHDAHPVLGPVLRSIGRPCLVEADASVSQLLGWELLPQKIARRFALNRGAMTGQATGYEDVIQVAVAASHVVGVLYLGNPEFSRLTGCDRWEERLW